MPRRNAQRKTSSWMQAGVEKTMRTIKGPAIFLAQFAGDKAPFNNLKNIASWTAKLGYKRAQITSWSARLFAPQPATESKSYSNKILGMLATHGLEITEPP